MPDCLYCQRSMPAGSPRCHHCGMPLPADAERARKQRLRRFQWFCAGLALFCAAMMIWLPRSLD